MLMLRIAHLMAGLISITVTARAISTSIYAYYATFILASIVLEIGIAFPFLFKMYEIEQC